MQTPQRGFTLLELMITVAVLAILLSLGVPSFAETIRNNRVAAQTNELVTALSLARSEASKRGMPVSVCAGATACGGAAESDWNTGWQVFTDLDGTAGQLDGGDLLLMTSPAVVNQISVTSNNVGFVRFRADGSLMNANAILLSVSHQNCTGINKREVSMVASGRVSMTKVAC